MISLPRLQLTLIKATFCTFRCDNESTCLYRRVWPWVQTCNARDYAWVLGENTAGW